MELARQVDVWSIEPALDVLAVKIETDCGLAGRGEVCSAPICNLPELSAGAREGILHRAPAVLGRDSRQAPAIIADISAARAVTAMPRWHLGSLRQGPWPAAGTRRISKGKAGCPAELGVPIRIVEDQHGRILRSIMKREGTDDDCAVPPVREALERFPCLRAFGLDRGFRSPANRIELDKMLDRDPMPKKGRPSEAERARRSAPPFKEMRKWRSGVES